MLSATVAVERLESAVIAATTFGDECHCTVTPDGIEIHGTNETWEGWVDVSLPTAAFDSYCVSNTDPIELSIDLAKIRNVTRLVDGEDVAAIRIDDRAQSMELQVNNLTYRAALVVPEHVPTVHTQRPSYRPVTTRFAGQELHIPVTLASDITSRMTITTTENEDVVSITAHGDDDSLAYTVAQIPSETGRSESITAVFSAENLSAIHDSIPDETRVRLAIGENGPMVLQHPFADDEALARYRLERIE